VTTPFTPVPATRAVGQGNPPVDMNNTSLELAALGGTWSVLNAAYAGGADPTGTDDSTAAFQDAISALPSGGGTITVPPGTYKINTGALAPVSGLRLTGAGSGVTTLVSTANSIISAGASQVTGFELDHLTLEATGSDIFTGANCVGWHVHDCAFIQNSAGNAIWNAATVSLMIECVFERNTEKVYGATRTIDAWYLSSDSNSTNVNACTWRDNVCTNENADASAYWYHVIGTTGSTLNRQNIFRNIVFEHNYGGMIHLESAGQSLIELCIDWDTSNDVEQDLIKLTTNAGTPVTNTVRQCGAVSATLAGGVSTISTDSGCTGTVIESPLPSSVISLNGSAHNTLLGMPGTYTLNLGGATFADSYANAKAPAAPLTSTPTAPTGTASTTLVMMGLGTNATGTPWSCTPQSSGNVLVLVSGETSNTGAHNQTYGGRYGTGTAPVNTTAVTGTRFGGPSDQTTEAGAATVAVPFALSAVLSLTPGTAYWFDLALETGNAAGTASFAELSFTAIELS
jgi:Pectate lyase superfamily protein